MLAPDAKHKSIIRNSKTGVTQKQCTTLQVHMPEPHILAAVFIMMIAMDHAWTIHTSVELQQTPHQAAVILNNDVV